MSLPPPQSLFKGGKKFKVDYSFASGTSENAVKVISNTTTKSTLAKNILFALSPQHWGKETKKSKLPLFSDVRKKENCYFLISPPDVAASAAVAFRKKSKIFIVRYKHLTMRNDWLYLRTAVCSSALFRTNVLSLFPTQVEKKTNEKSQRYLQFAANT